MKPFTAITILLLLLVAAGHALRLWFNLDVAVNGVAIPGWASAVGLAIAAVLAVGLWREAQTRQ